MGKETLDEGGESVFSIDKRCRLDNISRAALVRSEPVEKKTILDLRG